MSWRPAVRPSTAASPAAAPAIAACFSAMIGMRRQGHGRDHRHQQQQQGELVEEITPRSAPSPLRLPVSGSRSTEAWAASPNSSESARPRPAMRGAPTTTKNGGTRAAIAIADGRQGRARPRTRSTASFRMSAPIRPSPATSSITSTPPDRDRPVRASGLRASPSGSALPHGRALPRVGNGGRVVNRRFSGGYPSAERFCACGRADLDPLRGVSIDINRHVR